LRLVQQGWKKLPSAASSGAGPVVKVLVCAQTVSAPSSAPQSWNVYEVSAASSSTSCEIGPDAPAGQRSGCVTRGEALEPVCQYLNTELAGPLSAVPFPFSTAVSPVISVAGSVEP
jgi:hypothetical protein